MRNKANKIRPTKSGDDQHDPPVYCMVQQEEMVMGWGGGGRAKEK